MGCLPGKKEYAEHLKAQEGLSRTNASPSTTMKLVLEEKLTQGAAGTWTFQLPLQQLSPCSSPLACVSRQWGILQLREAKNPLN